VKQGENRRSAEPTTQVSRNAAASSAEGMVIRTPDQRLRVFVSSSLREVQEERNAAREAISSLRLTPVLFELGARPYPPRALYRAYLDQSHVFVGIYWQQYGWIAATMDISALEDEYRLAADKPRLIYVREPAPERDPRLAALIERIERDGQSSYKSFQSASELQILIEDDLAVLLSERFEAVRDAASPPADQAQPRSVGVPVPASRFIGREREVRALRDLLAQPDVRLVTLTGPGGIGKTRLALEVAAGVRGRFRDDVSVVALDSVPSAGTVAPAIQQALGLRDVSGRDPIEVLKDSLRDQEMLLVLDGFERVIGAAPVVADLLEACADLKALVTSREVLRISGERVFDVPPLAVPESARLPAETLERSDAVRLFVDRAQAVSEGFRLDDANAPAVAEIARRLEGLPLAIELAAARVRMLPPAAILSRLDSHLGLLTGGPRDLPERQRTLRRTIDWSYDLLEQRDRALLARLGVFVGGWTLDAVESVCADGDMDAVEALSSLIDKSLVRQDGFACDEPRFTMLETMREYALERLTERGETERRRDLHADYFLALAESAVPEHMTAPLERSVERLAVESGNIRAATRWLLDRAAPGQAARMGWALWNAWWVRWYLPEAVAWMAEALAARDALSTEEHMMATFVFGISSWGLGDDVNGLPRLRQAYALAQDLGDRGKIATAQATLGAATARSGDFEEGEELVREALATFRTLGDPWATVYAAETVFGFSQVMQMQGRSEEALPLLEETVGWARSAGEMMMLQIALMNLGQARLGVRDAAGAQAALLESLELADDLGNRGGSPSTLNALAAVAVARGDPERGATLLGAAEGARRSVGTTTWVRDWVTHERTERVLRAALGDDRFTETFTKGATLTIPDALRVAGEL
jgi:predicted ATPase